MRVLLTVSMMSCLAILLLVSVHLADGTATKSVSSVPQLASAPIASSQPVRFSTLAKRNVYATHDLMNVVRGSDGILWAAGYDGHDPNRLFRSRDGRDWEIVPVKTGDWVLADLAFSDDRTLWAIGNHGTLIRSQDAGAIWQTRPKPVRTDLDSIVFASPRVGYIGGVEIRPDLMDYEGMWGPGYAFLLRTQDGGETWQVSYRCEEGPGSVFSIAAFSETGALVSIGGRQLIRTGDGGKSWHKVGTADMDPHTVRCLPSGVSWAVGPKGFFRSDDTGKTWSRVTSTPDVFSGRYWWSIAFANESVGVAVGDRGACVLTRDGGRSWAEVPNPPESVFGADHLRSIELYGAWGLILGSQSLYRIDLPFLAAAEPDV